MQISLKFPAEQLPRWQKELACAFTKPEALLKFLDLDPQLFPESTNAAASKFPLKVTRSFASRMIKGNINDPLLRQVLPLSDELLCTQGYSDDPVGDQSAIRSHGLLHKYHGRVLLISTGACAIHCRYCFRREFPYNEESFNSREERRGLEYIAANRAINEIILSGGDPLVLNDAKLRDLIGKIAEISHVRRLRIHSRLPIVLPSRITVELLQLLTETRLQVVLVLHSNHPNELDRTVGDATKMISEANIPLFNQAVLLKGVNDCPSTLIDLSEALFSLNIMPYYLHLLDKARGTAHFDLPVDRVKRIQKELMRKLPGYLVPRIVKERSGGEYKIPV